MLLGRMAYRLSLLCLATWTTTLPAIAAAQTANITPEILNFVPACAQKCFKSFVSANFDGEVCGNSPSLQCLCRQRGSSGYTIGEGAASCLVGESRFGACQGQDGISDTTATAYNMCVGVSRAEPKTHSTIVATLILPASGTGPLLVPTAIQTATSTGTAARTATTTPTSTVSLPTGEEPSSTTATSTTPTTSALPTATASTGSETSDDKPDDKPQLSSAQIAGITLGCGAVVVFGILLVLLARCIRRKRFGDLESGFSRMRDSMSFGRKSRPSSAPGGLQISSPLHRVQTGRNPADPRWQPSIPQQGGVGLAISPLAARGGVFARPSPALASVLAASRPPTPPAKPTPVSAPALAPPPRSVPKVVRSPAPAPRAPAADRSPPKPALTLAIPTGQERVARVPANARDSVVTEFAEDGEGDIAPGTAVWRPPTSDPLSATTFYFADKGGNWILRNASTRNPGPGTSGRESGPPTRQVIQEVPAAPVEVELPSPDHKTRAERAKDAYGGFSPDAVVSPLRLPRKPGNGRLGSPIAFRDQRREPQLSSPSLSARLSQTAETITSEPSQAYFTIMRESRDLTGGKIKRRSTRRVSRRVSQDSATSIESALEDEDVIDDEPQVDLSPVAESPQTPISPGKSPVKYPKIPRHNHQQQQMPPPKPQPKKAAESELLPPAHRYNVWHPPGHSSPTGAGAMPMPTTTTKTVPHLSSGGPPRRPWNAPNLNPNRNMNPAQPRTGSPEIRAGPISPTDTQYRPQQQRQQRQAPPNPEAYWNQPPTAAVRARQQPQQPPPPPTPPYELPGENTPSSRRRYDTPPLQQQQQQQQYQQQQNRRPGQLPTPAATPQPQSHPAVGAAAGDTSSQGSLLAKRRGADKVAALTLVNSKAGGKGARKGGNNKAGWTREEQELYGTPVPITPGWVPELTPTRRGADLYLNVR
ncbi:hypothetical protein C8A01DRAFT_21093 [Parachaetomium inaequale]|uniref:Extracellular membrane protein CFEM domain-containing protein n=1 Tax=Parachaetomium inaequale TaxID=2588326 RepID=A0AAN6P955_9PEZI|nr:hypothetical protein C8A01DRAFT_21093 [Parachaetomium inaequale]